MKLDAAGRLKTTIPIHVGEVSLELSVLEETLTLVLGALDPTPEPHTEDFKWTGVQQRLSAFGYGAAPTGLLDESTRFALARFQEDELGRKDANGELDAQTLAKLEECYGV